MNRTSNLLPAITESILRFLPIEEAVRTSIISREWWAELTDVSESSNGAESSDGERMFDQPNMWLEHLNELEITIFSSEESVLDFAKLVLAKSPQLKKVGIRLHKKVDKAEEYGKAKLLWLSEIYKGFRSASQKAYIDLELTRMDQYHPINGNIFAAWRALGKIVYRLELIVSLEASLLSRSCVVLFSLRGSVCPHFFRCDLAQLVLRRMMQMGWGLLLMTGHRSTSGVLIFRFRFPLRSKLCWRECSSYLGGLSGTLGIGSFLKNLLQDVRKFLML
ncbi:hypothetical protein Tco_0561432 [Tanacetum coccineum]